MTPPESDRTHRSAAPADPALEQLGGEKYVLVTTFRRNGTPVPTPVWVVRDGAALGIWTTADSGKVKRIRNREDVLVTASDVRGRAKPDAPSLTARATLAGPEETARFRKLIARKYGITGRLVLLGSRLRRGEHGTVGVRVTLTGTQDEG
ncbi:PPOX class F420-dependent oxidoreductase [Actinacidiphila alni]|uniref:PPOX class F420-dependent oxidoreductase n=1 Tax=Actinacidiphila alni TaxID=380248 RepID=UPI0033E41200